MTCTLKFISSTPNTPFVVGSETTEEELRGVIRAAGVKLELLDADVTEVYHHVHFLTCRATVPMADPITATQRGGEEARIGEAKAGAQTSPYAG